MNNYNEKHNKIADNRKANARSKHVDWNNK